MKIKRRRRKKKEKKKKKGKKKKGKKEKKKGLGRCCVGTIFVHDYDSSVLVVPSKFGQSGHFLVTLVTLHVSVKKLKVSVHSGSQKQMGLVGLISRPSNRFELCPLRRG